MGWWAYHDRRFVDEAKNESRLATRRRSGNYGGKRMSKRQSHTSLYTGPLPRRLQRRLIITPPPKNDSARVTIANKIVSIIPRVQSKLRSVYV